MGDIWRDGIYGLVTADALGVPVEFENRSARILDPVEDMRGYGVHNQVPGTWSDDSSMTIATLDSIFEKDGIDYEDIMIRFGNWCLYGDYTCGGELFDIGNTTVDAIKRWGRGAKPLDSGAVEEYSNGNGSLMRVLPACLFLYEEEKKGKISERQCVGTICDISSLTHAHLRSQIACSIYYFLVKAILDYTDESLIDRLQKGMDASIYYINSENRMEYKNFNRLFDLHRFKDTPENEISSSGYVVDSLEAAVWSLLNTSSYSEAVLKAVNLGDDTDTVGAIAGGLAGLFYGYEDIPKEWVEILQGKDLIDGVLAKQGNEFE